MAPRLLARADADQVPDQSATLSVLLDRWLEVFNHELSTREATDGLGVTTRARRGEVVALRWTAVDLEKATLVVAHNYLVRSASGSSRRRRRMRSGGCPWTRSPSSLLTDFRAAREAASGARAPHPGRDAFLFSPDPVCDHPDHFTHAFRELAGPLGVDKPPEDHGFRIAIFLTRTHQRLVSPGLAQARPTPLRRQFDQLDTAIDAYPMRQNLIA